MKQNLTFHPAFWTGLILFIFASNMCLLGQELQVYNYTIADGLPSTYMYDVEEDENGFIWVATEDGIAKFDGINFVKNPIPELANKEVVNIWKDKIGRMWFLDLSSKLYYLQEKTLYQLKHKSGMLLKFVYKTDKDNNFWLSENGKVMKYTVDKNEVITESFETDTLIAIRQFIEDDNGNMLVIGLDKIFKAINGKLELIKNEEIPVGGRESNIVSFKNNFLALGFNTLYIVDKNTFEIKTAYPEFQEQIKHKPTYLFKENENSFWLSTRNGLFNIEANRDEAPTIKTLLDGKSVGIVIKDSKGGFWITTQRAGLFYIPGKDLKNHINAETNNQITDVRYNEKEEKYVIGYTNGLIVVLDKDLNQISSNVETLKSYEVYDIILNPNGKIEVYSAKGLFIFDYSLNHVDVEIIQSFKIARSSKSGKVWIGLGYGFGYLENYEFTKIDGQRTYGVCPIHDDKVWVGNLDGLHLYENGKFKQIDHPDVKIDIRNIEVNSDSTLWLSTQGNGLIVYDPQKNEVVHHFTTENGLLSNNCRNCLIDEDYIWLATNKGLNRINKSTYEVNVIGEKQGLPSLEINDIIKVKDNILVATNRGLSSFDHQITLKEKAPKIYFSEIKVQDKDTIILPEYKLDYDQNNVKLKFTALDYKHPKDILYAYQMEGVDEHWIETTTAEAQYPVISEGIHTFAVKAKSINSEWSQPIKVKFNIATPFWKTWWFLILTFLLAMATIGLIMYAISNSIRRRTELREKLKNSQLTALRAQMNPHFIFNSLNSIQDFIMREDKKSANYYLSQFAKLMRNILNMSTIQEVSLEQEIETLNFYLRLEALRFEKNFIYNIVVDENIDQEMTTIPSLVIQPYVENAIKHGLMHKKGMKELTIRFMKDNNDLICEVEDNGIGFKKSMEIQAKNHKMYPSKALKIINERMAIINSTNANKLKVNVESLQNGSDIPKGTKVIISINQTSKS